MRLANTLVNLIFVKSCNGIMSTQPSRNKHSIDDSSAPAVAETTESEFKATVTTKQINLATKGKEMGSNLMTAVPGADVIRSNVGLHAGRNPSKAVNITVSSRALFNTGPDVDRIEDPNFEKYFKRMIESETTPYGPGAAFSFIQALSNVNSCLLEIDPDEKEERFKVILMSHNHPHVGIKLINSINYHGLEIERMCLTGGEIPIPGYLRAYNVSLFLTSYPEEVKKALQCGFAAAVMTYQSVKDTPRDQLRVAFDLDAVLFSDKSEAEFKKGGLKIFKENEQINADIPLEEGPLKEFAESLGKMQQKFKDNSHIIKVPPIKIYVVTSRDAICGGERALKTLRGWGLIIDEIHFLAGTSKGSILKEIKPHIFFDDQKTHIDSAKFEGVPSAQVPNTLDEKVKPSDSQKKILKYAVDSSQVNQKPLPMTAMMSAYVFFQSLWNFR